MWIGVLRDLPKWLGGDREKPEGRNEGSQEVTGSFPPLGVILSRRPGR